MLAVLACTSNGQWSTCATANSNVYFKGRLLMKAAGGYMPADRLGSVGTGSAYFPYGEEKGSPPTPTGVERFATYYRDFVGQDYADQRYYSSNTGSFFSPDPSMDNVDYADPGSWNAYAYANGDPINFNDPSGLQTCGQIPIAAGVFKGMTVSDVMTGTSGNDLLAQIIWHEGGTIYSSDLSNVAAYEQDLAAIGTAVLNQWDVDNGKIKVYQHGRAVCPLGQCLDRSLQEIIIDIATYYDSSGNLVHTFDSSGHMQGTAATTLSNILNTNTLTGPIVYDNGNPINISCEGVIASLVNASNLLDGSEARVSPNGLTLLFWNQASPTSTTTFPGNVGYTGWRDDRSRGETFWGLSSTPPVRRPPPPRRPR